MSYCINPDCHRQNPDDFNCCPACGTSMLLKNRYRLVRPLRDLHRSFYIEVFEIDDLGTPKVLKILKNDDDTLLRLFRREADVLISLRHQGIPQVESGGYFSISLSSNQRQLHCLVMERIEGQDLEKFLREHGSISEELALDWLRQLAKILHEVHQKGLFHRDIKPSNIMRKPDGQLVLIDFGAARWVTDTVVRGGQDITHVFTYGYAAPEQRQRRAVPQSDFFALGRTFVHLLTGKYPDDFSQNPQTNQLIWRKNAPQISDPLANFIDELMAPFLENRPQNTQGILQHLDYIERSLEHTDITQLDPFPQPHPQNGRVSTQIQEEQSTVSPPLPPRPRFPRLLNRWGIIFGLPIILLVGVCIGLIIVQPSPLPPQVCNSPALDVSEMAFSPNGKYLATASLDNTVRVFDATQLLKAIGDKKPVACKLHKDGVVALKFSPPDSTKNIKIATASLDGNVGLWNMNIDGSISILKTLEHNQSPVVALAFSPKGNYLATGTSGGTVRVWDTNTLQEIKLKPYGEYVKAVSFSLDEKYLAIVGLNNKAQVWEWQAEKATPLNDVVAVAFSPKDGNYLATADAKGNAQVRDITTFNIVNTVNLKTYPTAISFSPEGKHLVLIGLDKKAKLWEWENNDTTIPLERDSKDEVVAIAFSPKDGKYLATASANGTVTVWNNNGTKFTDLPNNNNSLVALAFSPTDEKQLAVAGADGSLQIKKW
ncbi:WD40 repeat domain-containing serine/threonine-protein kinase [Scytonema sp. PRP1]|uniref:WD40 repeat domain-containing serine/threonine-protein kinase n=1 Tax=Scytonema sp. PRP1 TaxID=3120513 RepID=UPI002FD0F1AA